MATRKVLTPNMKKIWTMHTETWPVIGCIAAACGWCAFMGGRHLFTSPDVSWDRTTRSHAIVKENQTEGERWSAHKNTKVAKDMFEISTLSSFERKY